MDLSCRRRGGGKNSAVLVGSVWETRMKSDEFKGGIMVFNGEEDGANGGKRLSLKKDQTVGGGKRKTWKNESFDGFEKKNPTIQIGKESVEGIKKTPIRVSNGRSSVEHCKDLSLVVDNGVKKTPFQVRKGAGKCVDMKKQRSEVLTRAGKSNGNEGNSVELRSKSEGNGDLDLDSIEENEKNPVETDKNSEESGVFQEKIISSCANNGDTAKSSPESLLLDDGDDDDVEDEEFYEDEETEAGNEKKNFEIKEMNVQDEKLVKIANEVKQSPEEKGSKVVDGVKLATSVYTIPTKSKSFAASDEFHYQTFPQTQNKLQNIVMWRDASKSALIFGVGTFITISSSYTQDLNISFISVISYVGLVYLAAIFLHRSIICRGVMEIDEPSCVVGEEEAIWLLDLFLPYLNEFLSKLKALFSGDPATTMKLAVLLFVLAKCGSSITIWKMAKLGFFGVFIVPKLCSSYSNQLTAYGKFWIRRLRDAWDSCTHKKAAAMAVFTLVWNLCSTVARIWAAFVLFVALRYYQQKMAAEDDAPASEETWEGSIGKQRQRHGLRMSEVEPVKDKKGS